jgi:imidazolonepropionase-like amidohydrolase
MIRHLLRSLPALVSLLAATAVAAETLLLENIRPVDVTSARIDASATLAVRDGWIVDRSSVDATTARRIAADGLFVIPGLAEMHAHVPPMSDRQRVDDVLALFLAHGVTTIRGMLGEPGHLQLRAELARGERVGPRLITSGPSLNGNSVPDAAAARRLVRRQAEAGYDFLKLHPGLMPEPFAAIDSAADGLDIDHAGHVSVAVGLERALAAGQATIDHLDGYAQVLVPPDHPARRSPPGFFGIALAEAMEPGRIEAWARRTAEAGVANVPTQTLIEHIAVGDVEQLSARPAMRWVPAERRARWIERIEALRAGHAPEALARFVDIRRRLIATLHEAGAPVLAGADAPQIMNVPGDSLHEELALYVASGLTPAEALATSTAAVAGFFGQPAHACLQPGCVADLVLLEADPLADIANARRIRAVVRAGEWFGRERLDRVLADIAARAEPTGPD